MTKKERNVIGVLLGNNTVDTSLHVKMSCFKLYASVTADGTCKYQH